MQQTKSLKRGEILFKEGESTSSIYIIKSGKISLNVARSNKKIEVMTLFPSQVFGEQALLGAARQPFQAEAIAATELIEVPASVLKGQFDNSPAGMKLLTKSLIDEVKQERTTLRSLRMEQDDSPCPQIVIPKVFTILNLVARHSGKPAEDEENAVVLDWGTLKLYSSRMFLESPQRMQNAVELLAKLGWASLHFETNDDGEEELSRITLRQVQLLEDFAEFYQHNLYKGGKSEVIYLDPTALKAGKALVGISHNEEVDRQGSVNMDYDAANEEIKNRYGFELKNTHFEALERKGLFAQRKSKGETVYLQFDKQEFQNIVSYWRIINEIEKWNDKGFVDRHEVEEGQGSSEEASGPQCPSCTGPISEDHKFCPNCGSKLAAA